MALIAHLYMKRWLAEGDLSDRRTAYQIYSSLLTNRELPSVERQLIFGMLERMRSPEGSWTTNEGQRRYSVTAKQSGGFLVGFATEDIERMISQPAAQLLQNAPSYLAFAPYDAEFSGTNESGKLTGTSFHIDAACGYKQALQIDLSPDGTSMELTGTITQVTGVLRYLSDTIGKKRVEKMCRKPGAQGLRLALYRLPAKEAFFEVDFMLNTDLQPLASGGK